MTDSSASRQPPTARPLPIMIVDSLGDLARGLQIPLQLRGHEVSIASSNHEALSVYCNSQPRIVVVKDLSSTTEVIELVGKLRHYPGSGPPVLVASASDACRELYEVDLFDHWLPEPLLLTTLLELVQQIRIAKPLRKARSSRPR
jgi:DNA-binding response OmpR family regulator